MMNRIHHFCTQIGISVLLCTLLLSQCGLAPTEVSGSSTEAGNAENVAIVGTIRAGNTAASDALVNLRSPRYVTSDARGAVGFSSNTSTDSSGRFLLGKVDTGTYWIEVNNQQGMSVLIPVVCDGVLDTVLVQGELDSNATISGTVAFTDSAIQDGVVEIYGLDRSEQLDASGDFAISVPKGQYTVRISNERTLPQYAGDITAIAAQKTVIPPLTFNSPSDTTLPTEGFAVFSSDNLENLPIYRMDLSDRGSVYPIGYGRYAMISPDGGSIAYQLDTDDNADRKGMEIWTMDVDGTEPLRILSDLDYLNTIHWDNTGERLVFSGNSPPVSEDDGSYMTGAISLLTLSNKKVEVVYQIVPTRTDFINQIDLHDSLMVFRRTHRIMYRTLDGSDSGQVAFDFNGGAHFDPSGTRVVSMHEASGEGIRIYERDASLQWSVVADFPLPEFSRVNWSNHPEWLIGYHTREYALYAIHVSSGKIAPLYNAPAEHRLVGSLYIP